MAFAGCSGANASPTPTPATDGPSHESYLTIFLIDGLATDVFQDELLRGGLPNLSALIVSGTYTDQTVTAFPSVSGYAHYPLVTGRAAWESGIYGLRWFDRSLTEGNFRNYIGRTSEHLNLDLAEHIPTIFEQVAPATSGVYNSIIGRGATHPTTLGMDFLLSKYRSESLGVDVLNGAIQVFNVLPKFGLADDLAANPEDVERKLLDRAIRGMEADERVQLVVFTTLDNMNHLEGYALEDGNPRPEYIAQLRLLDDLIGQYRRASLDAGTEDRRIYLITSDHGVDQVTSNVSVPAELESRFGLRYDRDEAVRRGSGLDKSLEDYVEDEVDLVQAIQGNGHAYFYFRDPERDGLASWSEPISPERLQAYPTPSGEVVDLPHEIAALPGIEFVVHRSPDGLAVISPEGAGEIRAAADDRLEYRVLSGTDPLGYAVELRDVPLDRDAWLARTAGSTYPYAVVLLWDLAEAHPDADLSVTTAEGFDHGLDFEFVVGNYRGGHGGLHRRQLVVPAILKGPGIPRGHRLPHTRLEDLMSTVQVLMDLPPGSPERVVREIVPSAGGGS